MKKIFLIFIELLFIWNCSAQSNKLVGRGYTISDHVATYVYYFESDATIIMRHGDNVSVCSYVFDDFTGTITVSRVGTDGKIHEHIFRVQFFDSYSILYSPSMDVQLMEDSQTARRLTEKYGKKKDEPKNLSSSTESNKNTKQNQSVKSNKEPSNKSETENYKNEDIRIGVIIDPDGYVNIRKGPGTDYPILGRIFENEKFSYRIVNENWVSIKIKDGTVGYIHSSRVREIDNSY